MFGDVVLGIEHSLFEAEMHAVKVGGARCLWAARFGTRRPCA